MKKQMLLLALIISTTTGTAQYAGPEDCLDSLKVPNVFTPNNDGANEVFFINFPCAPEKFELTILNRWGEEIYTTKTYTFAWNGTHKKLGEMPDGVYHYTLQFTYFGKQKTLSGELMLMR